MLKALTKTLTQFLSDPKLWLVTLLCGLISLLLFLGIWWGVREGLGWMAEAWPRWAGWLKYGEGTLAAVMTLLLALLLFPVTFVVTASFFQETVADAVEARHYPALPPANGASLRVSVLSALRFAALMLAVNVVAFPFYLTLLWFAGSGAALMLAVNGLLAGREYFEIVALRRMPRREMDTVRRANRLTLFLTGVLIAAMALVPVLNLLAPVLGIAVMAHIFHGLPRRA